MSNKSEFLNNISSHSLEEISRNDYMLLTLSTAAIGYTINLTISLPINLHLIPSLLAVFFWGISIICTVSAMNSKLETFNTIIKSSSLAEITETIKDLKIDSNFESDRKDSTVTALKNSITKQRLKFEKELKSYERKVKISKVLFVVGVIFFVFWWVLKLLQNAPTS